jgi:hypothetical protein
MRTKLTLAVVVLVGVIAAAANAQSTSRSSATQADGSDARWLPWLGCWQLIAEGNREGDADPQSIRGNVVPGDMRVCVVPASDATSVQMSTLSGAQVLLEEMVAADGKDRPVSEANCRGSKRAEWSQDGQRLFTHAELACQSQPVRQLSGISLIAPGGLWVDIQFVDSPGDERVRVRRYRRTTDLDPAGRLTPDLLSRATSAAQGLGGAAFEVDDVIEASKKVSLRALEAALVERQATFALDRRLLVKLDEAGVEDTVIDLMVALSYPDRFVVDRSSGGGSYGPSGASSINFDPFWYGSYFPYYYYSPFGYSYWGRYGWYDPFYPYYPYYPGGGSVIIVPPDGGGDGRPPAGHGRVVNGLGYTRVRPRDATNEGSTGGSRSGNASTRASSGGSSSGSSESSGSSGSSGGSMSPSGASSGGSGDSGGRSAVPR